MAQAVQSMKIKLYKVDGVMVESHLAFIDDVIFFCQESSKSLSALKEI